MYKLGNVFFLRVFKYAQGNPTLRSAQWNVDMELENNSYFAKEFAQNAAYFYQNKIKLGHFLHLCVCDFLNWSLIDD